MLPSGGRGAAMRQFLSNLAKEEEQRQSAEKPPDQPVRPVGRGRAMFLSEFDIEQRMKGMALSPTESGRGEEVAIARGRGIIMQSQMAGNVGRTSYHGGISPEQGGAGPSRETPVEVARPVGRGRSALVAAFLSQQKLAAPGGTPSPSSSSPPPPPSPPVKRDTGYALQERKDEEVERTTSTGPVIRRGNHGESVEMVTNYISMEVIPGKGVFMYSVEFSPSEDNISMKTRMINQHLEQLGGVKSYNGVRLYLSIELDKVTSYRCEHPETGQTVNMSLACKGCASGRDVADIYNMLFRRIMVHLGLKNMGRKFFDPSGAMSVPQHRLEVWPGYVTAVQQFEGGVKLCCDASHRVMRTESVLDVMKQLAHSFPQKYREETLKVVLGAVVLTRYNNKVYRVDDISWDQSPNSTFTDSDGRELSFSNYYKRLYDIDIKDKNQPLLVSRIKRKKEPMRKGEQEELRLICLIPELCYITGLTDAMRADFRIMKDLTQKLQLTPLERYEGLCKFLQNIRDNKPSTELLMKWGLQVSAKPVKLTARVVQQETLLFKDSAIKLNTGSASWVVNNALFAPKEIRYWAILHVAQDSRVAKDFESSMVKVSSQMGMKVYNSKLVKVADNRNEHFLDALRATIGPELQLVVIFFPSLRSDRYAAVKKVCCIERPISSQVIQSRTLSRPEKAKSIIKKIAMQINCKLGGALWGLKIPYDKLMVCGMDVYHCATGKNKSVMAFVATSDPQQITWYSRVGFGGNHQELADNLRICMGGALKKYCEVSGFYPDRIIMFRDGVGDGQLRMTKEFEVPQMLQSFNDLRVTYKPKMSVIVCQKRIMTRLLSVQGSSGPRLRLQNPPPGTVMDHTITKYDWYDFFLVSQSSNRGTVSPTHYVVVYDDGETQPDHLQRMTYKMTHLYYNWTGTISIPAPAQYAHRLAQLVGLHLHKDPSSMLCDRLYFL